MEEKYLNTISDMIDKSDRETRRLISEMKSDIGSVSSKVDRVDNKLQKSTLDMSTKISSIDTQLKNLHKRQDKQDKEMKEMREQQLQCKASQQWDIVVDSIQKHDRAIQELDKDITGVHNIDNLKRNGKSDPPKRKTLSSLGSRWIPLLIALVTAAGILGGAAALKWIIPVNAFAQETISHIDAGIKED